MSLLDTLLTAYMYENSKNSDPKVTTAPSTPGEQFLLDQYKNALSNPSPQRQAASSAAMQTLGNMGSFNPSSFSFVSPLMKGQTFAGGMKIPSMDFSKIDFSKGFGTGGSTGGTNTGSSGTTVPTSSVNGNGPGGMDLGGFTIGGVPAAPSITDPNPTTGTDLMNFGGKNAGLIGQILNLLGVPSGMTNALQSYLMSHLAGNLGQNLQTKPSQTLNQWANSNQQINMPGGNEGAWGNTAGNQMGDVINGLLGGGGMEDPKQLPTNTPNIPNLTPKT